MIPTAYYLAVSGALFATGLVGLLVRRGALPSGGMELALMASGCPNGRPRRARDGAGDEGHLSKPHTGTAPAP